MFSGQPNILIRSMTKWAASILIDRRCAEVATKYSEENGKLTEGAEKTDDPGDSEPPER